jgi:hypothetical protein
VTSGEGARWEDKACMCHPGLVAIVEYGAALRCECTYNRVNNA